MQTNPSPIHDVVVAGAGPVGLFLACELRLGGVPVLVLERAADPISPMKRPPFGLRGLSAPTLHALACRALLDDVRAAGRADDAGRVAASAHWMQARRRSAGHFAGIPFFHEDVDASRWRYRRPGAADLPLAVDMRSLETVLTARAIAAGVEIRRGCGVEDFAQSENGVTVRAGGETVRTRWLVGCDGGRSTVRKAGGFAFVGTDPEFTGYSVQAELANADALAPGRTYTSTGMYTYAKPGTIALVDYDGGACHRTGPITREHVQAVLRRVSGIDVVLLSLTLAATWTDRACQATEYRRGRVLLAGDAAHIHSPLGGQGLNLGFGDAMNLGWKLAATIQGRGPAGLLDTYAAERHPEGARILDWSRAQVALMRPSPATRAIVPIIRDLMGTRDGATYFAETVWGLSSCYPLGGTHPLVGRHVPDLELVDGTRVADTLRDGKGLLLDLGPDAPLRRLAEPWHDRIGYAAGDAKDDLGLGAVLVRPDGIVAWAGESGAAADGVVRAASRWFGEPRPAQVQAPLAG